MKRADTRIPMMRVVSVLAVIVFAGGCEQRMQVSGFGKVDEIPLLVRFENQCPKEVIETVANCAVPDSARDPNKPDEVPACRKQNEKIIWLAVIGASMPYQRDATLPKFKIVFKDSRYEPIESPYRQECKDLRNGVLDCKIKSDAPRDKWFDYSVVAGSCALDPRIYVP